MFRRKKLLKNILRRNDTLRYVDHIETNGLATFAGAHLLSMEGIIAKDPNSPYIEGPVKTWHWQKIKNDRYKRQEKINFHNKK